MKNIQEYQEFCLNESSAIFYQRHNMPTTYKERARKSYNLSDNPTVLTNVGNFFQKMEDKFTDVGNYMAQAQKLRRAERGGGPDTGVEALYGLFSLAPNILKKVFGPTKASFKNQIPSDKEVNLEFMRHTNEDFVKKDLPNIKTEDQMIAHVNDIYKKAGVKPKQSPVLDDIVRNRLNIYYDNQINPYGVRSN